MEVNPSCKPYSNSVAFNAFNANGNNSVFDKPKEISTTTCTENNDRRTGVLNSCRTPARRFRTTMATLVSSSA